MDDMEYYSMMRNQNLHHTSLKSAKKSKYRKWEIEQGREDVEMLVEKNESQGQEDNYLDDN